MAQCIAQWVSLAASRGLGQRSIARMGETKRTEAKPLRQPRRGRTAKAHKAAEKKGTLLFARFPPAWLTRTQDKARIECEKKKKNIYTVLQVGNRIEVQREGRPLLCLFQGVEPVDLRGAVLPCSCPGSGISPMARPSPHSNERRQCCENTAECQEEDQPRRCPHPSGKGSRGSVALTRLAGQIRQEQGRD